EVITADMIDFKVPGKGLSVQRMERILNKKAKRDINKYDYFTEFDL
ncbi:MAG: hypothetical protein ACD_31C00020G0001, partial [uncultured bacterium]